MVVVIIKFLYCFGRRGCFFYIVGLEGVFRWDRGFRGSVFYFVVCTVTVVVFLDFTFVF